LGQSFIQPTIQPNRLAYEIKQRLGLSRAPAYDLRTTLLEEVEREKSDAGS
jgi:hypothetical protein